MEKIKLSKEDNLFIYEMVRNVPSEAKKTIGAGRLKGYTDINPMYRIKKLTEIFGPVGIGWKTKTTNKEIIEGADGTKVAIVDIDLFVNYKKPYELDKDMWSEAIEGTGGSSLVTNEKSGPYTNDECYKMAYTDAISVACKSLGIGADVYWEKDRTKYDNQKEEPTTKTATKEEKASINLATKEQITKITVLAKERLAKILEFEKVTLETLTSEKADEIISKLSGGNK